MKSIFAFLFFLIFYVTGVQAGVVFNDPSKLNSMNVYKIIEVKNVADIRKALNEAKSKGLKISISGTRYAQGGQQCYPNSIVLDMLKFNKIIYLDKKHKIIRVQSGITWGKIQKYINSYGFALRVIQGYFNSFSVGGSLGSNIHGNDPKYGAIIETVQSFQLMLADGRIINVNRHENSELFKLAIGGYGLFGVIINVDLLLTDNAVYKQKFIFMDYKEYPKFFKAHILGNDNVGLHQADFLNTGNHALKNMRITIFTKITKNDKPSKNYRFRNEIMSVDVTPKKIIPDISLVALQEYFIPIDKFISFIDESKRIIRKFNVKPRHMYVRYMLKDNDSFLPYAKADTFAVGIDWSTHSNLSAQELEKISSLTRQFVDLALKSGGTFYLTKQLYLCPTREQLLKAYPEFNNFVDKKKEYDPQGIFMNQFFQHYISI